MKSALLAASVLLTTTAAQAELRSWVDEAGNVHIVDTDDASPQQPAPTTAEKPASTPITFQWMDSSGRLQMTASPPPKGATLLSQRVSSTNGERPNVGRRIVRLRSSSPKGMRFPWIVGVTGTGAKFDSRTLDDQPMWAAFVTMTCRHCRIEADVVRQLSPEFAPRTFVFFVKGGEREAAAFAEATGVHANQVVALAPALFPNGPVPLNVIVGESGRVDRAFTGRLPKRAFAALANRTLR